MTSPIPLAEIGQVAGQPKEEEDECSPGLPPSQTELPKDAENFRRRTLDSGQELPPSCGAIRSVDPTALLIETAPASSRQRILS